MVITEHVCPYREFCMTRQFRTINMNTVLNKQSVQYPIVASNIAEVPQLAHT